MFNLFKKKNNQNDDSKKKVATVPTLKEVDDHIFKLCKYGDDLAKLNDFQKVFYYNKTLDMEINNGGFDQYFLNSSGDYAHETVSSLKVVGADKTADILQDAINLFPDKIVPKDRLERQESLEKISPLANAFGDVDSRFFKYEDELDALHIKYIEKNREFFK